MDGLVSTHVQGSCRMGADAARAVVHQNGESHEVKRLFVGDASLIPRTLSVNPSLTIMALATRLAEHFGRRPERVPRREGRGRLRRRDEGGPRACQPNLLRDNLRGWDI